MYSFGILVSSEINNLKSSSLFDLLLIEDFGPVLVRPWYYLSRGQQFKPFHDVVLVVVFNSPRGNMAWRT